MRAVLPLLLCSGCSCVLLGARTAPASSHLGRRAFATIAAPALALGASAARAEEESAGAWAAHTGAFDESFLSGLESSPSGIRYKFLRQGAGEKPVSGQKVYVEYSGYLLDGTRFDSSFEKKPFSFRLGKGKVISGWEGLVQGMRPGMRIVAAIPPQFAYGDKGIGPIPAGAPLVFYMELVKLGDIK